MEIITEVGDTMSIAYPRFSLVRKATPSYYIYGMVILFFVLLVYYSSM